MGSVIIRLNQFLTRKHAYICHQSDIFLSLPLNSFGYIRFKIYFGTSIPGKQIVNKARRKRYVVEIDSFYVRSNLKNT